MRGKFKKEGDPGDLSIMILSFVNRPINFLNDGFQKQTKIDSYRTYEDIEREHLFEEQAYLKHAKGELVFIFIMCMFFILAFSCISPLFTMGVIQFDFSHINPTWWIMITIELAIYPSLTILIWKIRYQIIAEHSLLFRNMTSFSLEFGEGEIKTDASDFESKYASWLRQNQWSGRSIIERNSKQLDLIQKDSNIRLVFYDLSRKQNKAMSPLSENLLVEIAVFITALIASVVAMVINMSSVQELTAATVIQDIATLLFSCVIAILLGFFAASLSFKKALNLAVIRYFLYSYLTDAK